MSLAAAFETLICFNMMMLNIQRKKHRVDSAIKTKLAKFIVNWALCTVYEMLYSAVKTMLAQEAPIS